MKIAYKFIVFLGTASGVLGGMLPLARAQSPGSVDPSFNPGTGANNPVSTVAVQPDGKILAGGGVYLV